MANKDLIAVIEIGSSAITGAAGYRRPDGRLEVVACASEPSGEFIKNGVVRNIDKTAQCLTNIINLLEGQLPHTIIEQVYVGLCGYTVHSTPNSVSRSFEAETRVTADIVDEMANENQSVSTADRVVIRDIPQEFDVDGISTADPVGCNCRELRGSYLNLEARYSTMENLKAAFDAANIPTADDFVTPLMLADVATTPNERSLGCALVDIGAGTSTISIFKGGRLRFLSVVPLGDRLIASDLVSLGIAPDEAERIKQQYGLTIEATNDTLYTTESGTDVPLCHIGRAIRARFQEILANVEHQIRLAGFTDERMPSGYIFTGGALALPGAEAYIRRQAVFSKMRTATLPTEVQWSASETPTTSKQMIIATLIGAGTDPCCTVETPREIDFTQEKKYTIGSLFDDEGNSAQEERDRQEEERRQKERDQLDAERKRKEKMRHERKSSGILGRLRELKDKMADNLLSDNE